MENYEVRNGGLLVSTDHALLDFDLIQGFLKDCYWSTGITMEQVRRQIQHSSLTFGLYRLSGEGENRSPQQIGLTRVVSDLARLAVLNDVFIVPHEQRGGLGSFLLRSVLAHPDLRGIRKWLLATRDAHGVYAKLGFTALPNPEAYMVYRPADARWV